MERGEGGVTRGSGRAAPGQGSEQSCPPEVGPWCLLLWTYGGSAFPCVS